jgi:hypothetical protein
MAKPFELGKLLPWVAGGAALAGLENKFVGDQLDPRLKTINLGIGATTGALAASGPKGKMMALSGMPLKELALFGIASADRFKKEQEALTDTKLHTAKIEQETAKTQRSQAGKGRHIAEAFLAPALLGAGALTYYVHNQRKHPSQSSGGGKFNVVGQTGPSSPGRRKVRIDVPASAIPSDFFKSLTNADNTGKSRIQFLEQGDVSNNGASKKRASSIPDPNLFTLGDYYNQSWMKGLLNRLHGAEISTVHSKPVQLAKTLGNFAWQTTGIPNVIRGAKDLGSALGASSAGNTGVANRYALGAAGNLLTGIPSVQLGTGQLLKYTLGPERLMRAVEATSPTLLGRLRQRTITNTPHLSQWFLNSFHGRNLTAAERAALASEGPGGVTYNRLHNSMLANGGLGGNWELNNTMRDLKYKYTPKPWVPSTSVPKTIPGELLHGLRYGQHQVGELASRTGLALRRNPRATAGVIGMPLNLMGHSGWDVENELQQQSQPPVSPMPDNLPVSSNLSSLVNGLSSGSQMPVAYQLSGLYR